MGEKDSRVFNKTLDITETGNFEGKNIPNLLKGGEIESLSQEMLSKVYNYRKQRYLLHTDDKILTSWNALMISAMCWLYRVSRNEKYLEAAKNAENFIRQNMIKDSLLYASARDGKLGSNGFLDDHANYILALTILYDTTLEAEYLIEAKKLYSKTKTLFGDKDGGFYLYGSRGEQLIARPMECYDGAVPSGNSVMAYVMTRLYLYDRDENIKADLERQLKFIQPRAERFAMGHTMYLIALSRYLSETAKITVAAVQQVDVNDIVFNVPLDAAVVLCEQSNEYPAINGKTTYYVCKDNSCFAPSNSLDCFE